MPPRYKYKVTGINPKSGHIKSITVTAGSAEEAKTVAGEKGLITVMYTKEIEKLL